MQESIGTRLARYIRYNAVKPILILMAIQTAIFFPSAISPEQFAAALECNRSMWTGELWRPITATFCHQGLGHFLFNMIFLFLLGRWVLECIGLRFTIILIFIGGTAANIGHTVLYESSVIGFSGANLALAVAATVRQPHANFLFFPAWLFICVILGIDLVYFINSFFPSFNSTTAHDVHLFGALSGFLAMTSAPFFRKMRKAAEEKKQAMSQAAYADELSRVDELLEKISKEGLHTLNDEERQFLQRHSERERSRNS